MAISLCFITVLVTTPWGTNITLTLLNNIGAHKASYASIMFPAVAVIISTIVEGFAWSTYTFAGLFFILTGNLVVLIRTKKPLPNDNLTQAHDYKTEQPNIEHTNMKAQRL